MLKIAIVPITLKIISKLDLQPIIERLKGADIGENGNIKAEAAGILAAEVLAAITPQLGKIADDIPEFIAIYKGISPADAKELDLERVLDEITHDEALIGFFSRKFKAAIGRTSSVSSQITTLN